MKNIKLCLLTLSLLSGAQSFGMLRMATKAFRQATAAVRTPAFRASTVAAKPLAQPAAARSVASQAFSSRAIPAARAQVKASFAKKAAVFGGFASSLALGSAAFAQGKKDLIDTDSLPGETCKQARKSYDKTTRRELAIQDALECAQNPNKSERRSLESLYAEFISLKTKALQEKTIREKTIRETLAIETAKLVYTVGAYQKKLREIQEPLEQEIAAVEKQISESFYGVWLVQNTDSSLANAQSSLLHARQFDLLTQFSKIAHHYNTLDDIRLGYSSLGLTPEQEQARVLLKNQRDKIEDRLNESRLLIRKEALPFDMFAPNAAKESHQVSRVQDIDATKLWKSDGLALALEELTRDEITAINLHHAINMREYHATDGWWQAISGVPGKENTYRQQELRKLDSVFDPSKQEQYDLVLDTLYWRDVKSTKTTKK